MASAGDVDAVPDADPAPPARSRVSPLSTRRRRLVSSLVATLGGLAVAMAFPPFDLVFAMPIGLVALVCVVRADSGWAGFRYGFLFGLGFMLPLLRWITIIGPDAWIGLAALEALYFGLMGTAWAFARRSAWWPLLFAMAWVGADFLRGTTPFGGLPWGRLAFGLVDTGLVRYGRLGGTALVSFVVVLAVACVVWVFERRTSRRSLAILAIPAVALLLPAVLPVGAAGSTGEVTVAAVQGNVPGVGMDPFTERRVVLHNHAQATTDLAAAVAAGGVPQPDVVIWPENSTDIDPFVDPSAYAEIDAAVRAIGVPTLVGAVVNGPDAIHVQNMGIVWDPATGPGEQYVKRHPVPFGEYIPFRKLLTGFIERLGQIERDFAQGDTVGALDLGPVRIGDVICFEVAYDGLVRDVVDAGGELLVVQTNNATYTGTGQLQQQWAISRYRAVETGRTVVVASTNGISGVVQPDGEIVEMTDERIQHVIVQTVETADGVTPGVRVGRWVEWLISLAGLLAILTIRLRGHLRLDRMRK
jgi:apolipoprotein N-acyltransferase